MSHRITIICNSYPPEKGGAPTRIYHLAQLLKNSGYRVQVIAAMPNYPKGAIFPEYRGRLVFTEEMEGIKVRRIWTYPSNSNNFFLRGLSMLTHFLSLWLLAFPRLLFRRPDKIIVSSPPLLAAGAGVLIGRLTAKRTILNVSDIWPLSASELGAMKEGKMYCFMQWLEKRMYRRAQAWMAQSTETLVHMKEVAQQEKPPFLYRNLVHQDAAASSSPPSGSKKILYAGLLGHAQGVLEISEQINFSELGVCLDIFGDGAEREAIENFAEQNPDRGISLHDTISQSDLIKKLPEYSAMLIPLKKPIHGALPSKLFFAIAHQMPVLYCGGGEGAMITSKEKIGWVSDPGDAAALVQNIRSLKEQTATDMMEMKEKLKLCSDHVFNAAEQDLRFLSFLESVS